MMVLRSHPLSVTTVLMVHVASAAGQHSCSLADTCYLCVVRLAPRRPAATETQAQGPSKRCHADTMMWEARLTTSCTRDPMAGC
jgi:hypothetical protein